MLSFNELSSIDEIVEEFIAEIEEAGELDNFFEWIEMEDLGLVEEEVALHEKETMAAFGQRMRKQGRRLARMVKRASFQKKSKRSQVFRKTETKKRTSARNKTFRQVIPGAIMKAKGAVGAIKKRMWKAMKASVINRKIKPAIRKITRDEPKRMKQARANLANHAKAHI